MQTCPCNKLQLELNSVHIFSDSKSKSHLHTMNNQHLGSLRVFTIFLIFRLKIVTDNILPCGTPCSWLWSSVRVEPTLTLNSRLLKNSEGIKSIGLSDQYHVHLS